MFTYTNTQLDEMDPFFFLLTRFYLYLTLSDSHSICIRIYFGYYWPPATGHWIRLMGFSDMVFGLGCGFGFGSGCCWCCCRSRRVRSPQRADTSAARPSDLPSEGMAHKRESRRLATVLHNIAPEFLLNR